ncbi:MAG: ChuX/HutX family heme-like substrate-binding protein, partial [Pirellulaceae bacterium]|nr:ChuX/HutX family heme-like substrate-binding protein [Pirellulaceae bacterium]
DGLAMHKVFLQDDSDRAAFDKLISDLRSEDQGFVATPVDPPAADLPDSEVDREGFLEAFRAMEDTHQFFGLLRRFKLGRIQALRFMGEEFAVPLDAKAGTEVLQQASAQQLPIMVFVGNRGCIQIHTGEVNKIVPFGDWINVLDPDFNLHLRETGIATAWLVRKPTKDGVVTSVELFDEAGENLVLFFGKRKPGQAEDPKWRELAESLAK